MADRWVLLKQQAAKQKIELTDMDGLVHLLMRLLGEWSTNHRALAAVLQTGIDRGELTQGALIRWTGLWHHGSGRTVVRQGAALGAPRTRAELAQGRSAEHWELQRLEREIVSCSRLRPRNLVLLGRLLLSAEALCLALGCNFGQWQSDIEDSAGYSHYTGLAAIKAVRWGIPERLGRRVAVTRWITQGFPKDSAILAELIRVADEEGLSLSELKKRFSGERGMHQPPVWQGGEHPHAEVRLERRLARLRKEEEARSQLIRQLETELDRCRQRRRPPH